MNIIKIRVRLEGEVNTMWSLYLADGTIVECDSCDNESPYIDLESGTEKVYDFDKNGGKLGDLLTKAQGLNHNDLDVLWNMETDSIEYTWDIAKNVIYDIETQHPDEYGEDVYTKYKLTIPAR